MLRLAGPLAALWVCGCTFTERNLECPPTCAIPSDAGGAAGDGPLPSDSSSPGDPNLGDAAGDAAGGPPTLRILAGSSNLNNTAAIPSENAPLLHFLIESDLAQPTTLTSIAFAAAGSARDEMDYAAVELWRDDGDGRFEPAAGDDPVGSPGGFNNDDGTVTYGPLVEILPAMIIRGYWLSVDVRATAVETSTVQVTLSSSDLSAESTVGAVPAVVLGGPVVGTLHSLLIPPPPLDPQRYDLGITAVIERIAVDDFNRDGIMDLAVYDAGGTLRTFGGTRSAGNWTGFTAQWTATNNFMPPRALATADFDRDGDPDIARLSADRISIEENTGLGLTTAANLFTSIIDYHDMSTLDADHDGLPDIVAVARVGQELRLWLSSGLLTLGMPAIDATAAECRHLVVTDIDGDGNEDVVVRCATVLQIFAGDGLGDLAFVANVNATDMWDVVAGDFNRDSYPEVVVLGSDALQKTLSAGFGAGPTLGPLGVPVPTLSSAEFGAAWQGAGDFDGDSRLDVAVAHLGNAGADPAFEQVVIHTSNPGAAVYDFAAPAPYDGGADPRHLVVARVDDDADPDVVLADGVAVGTVTVLHGDGDAGGGTVGFDTGTRYPWQAGARYVATADFNRDGHPDIAVANDTTVAILTNDGDGTGFTEWDATSVAGAPRDLAVWDLGNNGAPDILYPMAGGLNDALGYLGIDRNLAVTSSSTFSHAGSHDPRGFALADVDQDGGLDIVYTQQADNALQVQFGSGSGFFMLSSSDRPTTVGDALRVRLHDWNRDGLLDAMVLGSPSRDLQLLLGQPVAPWFMTEDTLTADVLLGTPTDLAVGDLDRDGKPDVVIVGTGSVMHVLYGEAGSPFFLTHGPHPTPAPFASARLVDADRDGDLDIVAVSDVAMSGGIWVIPNLGPTSRTFGAPVGGGGIQGTHLAVADFNRDGDLDLVAAHTSGTPANDGVVVYLGN